jgi:hypothetical protein
MFCPSCGAENPEDSRFCASCGRALTAPETMLPESRRPRKVLIWATVGFLTIGGLLAWRVVGHPVDEVADAGSAGTTTTGAVSDAAVGYDEDRDEADLAIGVLERLPEAPEDAIASDSLAAVGGSEGVLPDGAAIEVIRSSWQRTGPVAEVVVEVVLPDGTRDRFGVVMARGADGWRVVYTVRASS